MFHLTIQRTLAHERSGGAVCIRIDQNSDGRISAKTCKSERTQEVEDVEDTENQVLRLLRQEASDEAFHSAIMANGVAGGRVKSFSILHGSLFDPVVGRKHGRESVGELQNTKRGNDGCKAREVGNTGREDEGYGPVTWDESHPQEFAGFVCERRAAEKLDEDVVVDY